MVTTAARVSRLRFQTGEGNTMRRGQITHVITQGRANAARATRRSARSDGGTSPTNTALAVIRM